MTDELVEFCPAVIIAEIRTIESVGNSMLCLEGEENKDWVYLGSRDKLNWELN